MYLAIHTTFLGSSASLGLLTQSQRKLGKCTHGCLCAQSLTADSPSSLPLAERGLFVAVDVLILMIQYCFYTLLWAFPPQLLLLSQLCTVFGNCLFYQAPNLPIFNFCFLSFLSCLSSVPEEFVLLSWTKGIQHHLPLLNKWEVLHWSLQITCLCTALLFCHYHGNNE